MITLDYLKNHPELKIYQDDEMFRINTDTQVLGEFIEVYKNDVVLDIGTNTGALMLYASLFNPKSIIGLDINEKALELAEKNMEINNITNYKLICADATNYRGEEVDVIICNPPYFKTASDKGKNKYKATAKHEGTINLENLIYTIRKNLKNYGTLFMLFQTSRIEEVFIELQKNHFSIKNMKFVYDENKEISNVFVLKAVKGAKKGTVVQKPIIINRG